MRRWVAEVGRELRDVQSQISFFRRRVESKIYREEPKPEPAEEKCHGCGDVAVKCRSCRKT